MKNVNQAITLWLTFSDGHTERKTFSSSFKAVSWLEKHPEVIRAGKVLE